MAINVVASLAKQALKRPSILKTLAKYTGRQILRRTGVFGTFGTFKRFIGKGYTKLELFKKLTTSIIKKNALRVLGPINYAIDIKTDGVKYALKQFGFQHLTPMAIKKLYYLSQNYKSLTNNKGSKRGIDPITAEGKKQIWKQLDWRNNKHSYAWKLEQIQHIIWIKNVPEKYKEKLLNNWFHFRVKSAQTGNFAVREYAWHPLTGTLIAYVRSKTGKVYGPYYAFGVPIDWIRKSIKTSSYGKKIYWVYYHK